MTPPGKASPPRPGGTRARAPEPIPLPNPVPAPEVASPDAGPPDFAPIATERLTLRPLVPEDAPALHRLINDWEVTRNLAVVPFPYPRDLADEWIASTRQQ